jgi:glucose/arabinose dehydrogenase
MTGIGGSAARRAGALALLACSAAACAQQASSDAAAAAAAADTQPAAAGASAPCEADDGGITLPAGFCATVFADGLGSVRHIVVRDDGTVFASTESGRGGNPPGGIIALRDTDGDGRSDVTERFGPRGGGTGLDLRGEWLYFGPDDGVVRYRIPAGAVTPAGEAETLVSGLPSDRSHAAKTLALSPDGNRVFVNIGSPSNTCQGPGGETARPGRDPCPELELRAGVWAFDANRGGQTQADGERFATGIRNAVAIAVHPQNGGLYVVQHGRDNLPQGWPQLYEPARGAELPAEELLRVEQGDDFGWPYCYYDPQTQEKVLAPEYGGDGREVGRCADMKDPIYGFPAHWAPNDLLFYTGTMFPEKYRSGVFVAFHGSWNRAPQPQAGYNVAFLPMSGPSAAGGAHEVFADGFAGGRMQPGEAAHRPTGLAQGPDGALYITSDASGRIWKVVYAQ